MSIVMDQVKVETGFGGDEVDMSATSAASCIKSEDGTDIDGGAKKHAKSAKAYELEEEEEWVEETVEMPEPKRIRELYLAAFSREPSADEVRISETHIAKPRADALGKPLDSQRAKRNGYEDLLWALMNTKEFLYNH